MRYIGFDIGDGESAVAAYEQGSGIEPVILPVCGSRSLLSAVGMRQGSIVVGESAYTGALSESLSVRFKSRFTTDASSYEDVVRFVRGVTDRLKEEGALSPEDHFVVGCPAGWSPAARNRYRELMIRGGITSPRMISESRAAFLYAKYAKTVALDIDILNESALVIDIGSSTLDFAYIVEGRETGVGTFGDTALGGGILDAALLRRSVDVSRDAKQIREVFSQAKSWHSWCEIEMRRLKEEYFNRLSRGENPRLTKTLKIYYDEPLKLTLQVNEEEIRRVVEEPIPELYGRSFRESLQEALTFAAHVTEEKPPRLLLLTGGASRMPFFRELCRNTFPGAVVICCPEPEFSIAKGLSYAGWVDENLQAFRQAIQDEITDERVSQAAQRELGDFMPEILEKLCDLLLEEAVIPVAKQWKSCEIPTLKEMNTRLERRVGQVLSSPMAEDALRGIIRSWIQGLTDDMQAMVDPICDRYEVPRKQMQLNLTAASESCPDMKAGDWVGLSIVGGVLGAVVSVLSGLLCGGSGIALVAAGPLGFVAGVLIGAIASLLGWTALSPLLLNANLPKGLRRISLEKRLRSPQVRKQLLQSLQKEMLPENSVFRRHAVQSFSSSFRSYLRSIAQAAEIPIE